MQHSTHLCRRPLLHTLFLMREPNMQLLLLQQLKQPQLFHVLQMLQQLLSPHQRTHPEGIELQNCKEDSRRSMASLCQPALLRWTHLCRQPLLHTLLLMLLLRHQSPKQEMLYQPKGCLGV